MWQATRKAAELIKLVTYCNKKLTNRRDVFIGHSRSPSIVPFRMLDIVSYCAIVTLSLFDFKNVMTLKLGSEVTQGH